MASLSEESIAKERLELLIQSQSNSIPDELNDNVNLQEEDVKFCTHCKNPDIMDVYPLLDWTLGLKLYYTLIQPFESFVKEHDYNRQTSNNLIEKCDYFPNKTFNIDEYDAKLTWGRADVNTGIHNCIFMYDATCLPLTSKEPILMSYSCKFPTKRTFTYKEYTFSYATSLEEAKPGNGWSDLPGVSDIKEEGLDNWLFYSKKDGFEGNDPSTYQIIGWNQEKFALYFTTQMNVEITYTKKSDDTNKE